MKQLAGESSRKAELFRFLFASLTAVGIVGLFAIKTMDDIIEFFTSFGPGDYGWRPFDEVARNYPGITHGIPGLLGVDITRNIGFADWLSPVDQLSWRTLRGPLLSDMEGAFNIYRQPEGAARDKAREKFYRSVSPAARNFWDMWFSEGAQHPELFKPGMIMDSKRRINAQGMGLVKRLLFTAGIRPLDLAIMDKQYWAALQYDAARRSERTAIVDDVVSLWNTDRKRAEEIREAGKLLGHTNLRRSINLKLNAKPMTPLESLLKRTAKGNKEEMKRRFFGGPPPPDEEIIPGPPSPQKPGGLIPGSWGDRKAKRENLLLGPPPAY